MLYSKPVGDMIVGASLNSPRVTPPPLGEALARHNPNTFGKPLPLVIRVIASNFALLICC